MQPRGKESVPVDITDKIGFALLKKGVIDYETLEASLKVKEGEGKRNRRNLGQILVQGFEVNHGNWKVRPLVRSRDRRTAGTGPLSLNSPGAELPRAQEASQAAAATRH